MTPTPTEIDVETLKRAVAPLDWMTRTANVNLVCNAAPALIAKWEGLRRERDEARASWATHMQLAHDRQNEKASLTARAEKAEADLATAKRFIAKAVARTAKQMPVHKALRAWFSFQSGSNADALYNAAHRYFDAKFVDPDDGD